MLHPIFQAQLPLISKIFEAHEIRNTYAFGSVISDKFNEQSDIDLLVNFKDGLGPLEKSEIWRVLHDKLRDIFNREIDLLIEGSLKNPYFIEEVNEKKQLIFAA